MNKRLMYTCLIILLIASIVLVISSIFTDKTEEVKSASASAVYVEEEVTESVEETEATSLVQEPNYDNIYGLLKNVECDADLSLVTNLLTPNYSVDGDWKVTYNKGYCDVFKFIDELNGDITVMCYANDMYIRHVSNTSMYTYVHNGKYYDYTHTYVSMVRDLMYREPVDDWKWSLFEITAICGSIEDMYPNVYVEFLDNKFMLDNDVYFTYKNGYVYHHGTDGNVERISLYTYVQSDELQTTVDMSTWLEPSDYNYDKIVTILDENLLMVPSSLTTLLEEIPTLNKQWIYYYELNDFTVYTVELSTEVVEGYIKKPVFMLECDTGLYTIY